MSDFDGVIGEALIKAAQQGYVDGRDHPMLPLAIRQHRERVPDQATQRLVFLADTRSLPRVAR